MRGKRVPAATLAALISLAVLGAGLATPAVASDRHERASHRGDRGLSKPVYDESVVEEYRVKTRYGTIYGVVERPEVSQGRKVPVILTYTPYSVFETPLSPLSTYNVSYDTEFWVSRGYARAFFDLVGTNGSSGCYDYGGIRERKTGKAVVDFLGTRSWSTGKVGMLGVSYDGTTQWAAAVEAPKHLVTIVPQVGIGRWWDYAFSQGVRFASGSGTPYLFDYGFGFLPTTHPTDPTKSLEATRDHVRPCERFKHNERAFLPDPVYDSFWDERDYLRRIDNVRASVLIEGSWRDGNVHPINSIEMWDALPARLPSKLVMAQQGHGDANLQDSQQLRHAWFDHWLLGTETGVMKLPRVVSVVNGSQRFEESDWPPPGTHTLALRLDKGDARSGALVLEDPREPVWTDGNPFLDEQLVLSGFGGNAALLFGGSELRRDVRISGTVVLHAEVVTDIENTWLTPVLFEESPNGSRRAITTGLLNARNRFSLRESVPLVPGQRWAGDVEFQPVDWVVKEGHRIGLALMSMNEDEALYWSGLVATNELQLGGKSRLLLPVSEGAGQLRDR